MENVNWGTVIVCVAMSIISTLVCTGFLLSKAIKTIEVLEVDYLEQTKNIVVKVVNDKLCSK